MRELMWAEHSQGKLKKSPDPPPLSFRDMAILGYTPEQASKYLVNASGAKAAQLLRKARQDLRREGWQTPWGEPAIPPADDTADAQQPGDKANHQLRSNWCRRLGARD